MEPGFENVATEEAQAARYQMMKGKNLLWVSCHYAGHMYPMLKPMISGVVELGVLLHCCVGTTEADKNFAKQMNEDGLASGILFADLSNDAMACENVYAAAVASGIKYDGVFSPHEVVQTMIGELAERLGLPGNTKEAYVKARDKYACRIACVENNIATPRYGPITMETADKVVEEVGLPMVLKPSSGSGSEGIYKAYTKEEVENRLQHLEDECKKNAIISWKPGLDFCILSEEYIDGPEFDVDVLMWDGKLVYANVIDNWPTLEPTFLETASNCPTIYSVTIQKQLVDYAYDCVTALGFKQGCYHVECKYSVHSSRVTKSETGEVLGQPILIEVNPRMGGGRTHLFHKSVYNVDLFDNFLMTAFGIPINPPASKEPLVCMADYDICAPKSGIILHNRWLDHIKGHPQLVESDFYKQPGEQVRGADAGVPEWVGMLILKGSTAEDVCNTLQAFMETIDIPISQTGEKIPTTDTVDELVEKVQTITVGDTNTAVDAA